MLRQEAERVRRLHRRGRDLIAEGWTTAGPARRCAVSRTAVCSSRAALTQRPELFAAAVCSAPVLDMVRYELSGLGERWVPEYGSAADPGQFENLLAYSPYHRVAEGVKYPAVLFTVFGSDTRVDPCTQGRCAPRCSTPRAGRRPVLLELRRGRRTVTAAVEQRHRLAADMLAFLGAHDRVD